MKNLLLFTVFILFFGSINAQSWLEKQKIVASDRAVGDYTGISVSISGDYAVVGAYSEDEDVNGGNTLNSSGAAYIYERNVAGNWIEVQKLVASDRAATDYFGYSVSISGDYLVVGAYGEDEDVNGNNARVYSGSAYVFERNASGNWIQKQKIVASDRGIQDQFGDAFSPSVEFEISGLALGFAYDMNVSSLSAATGGNGGPEIFIKFQNPSSSTYKKRSRSKSRF